ncbi:MAG: hypothetical protein JWP80_1033 [Pseudomonas sp.]|nr:hypothetical protein [Pseudomonas sp.]
MWNQYEKGHRSIWDLIGERRMEAERLAEANKPKGDFSAEHVVIEGAWAWLPGLKLDGPQPIESIVGVTADFEHDSQLVDASGLRRNLRRIPITGPQSAEVETLPRAAQLLKSMFTQWHDFASEMEWLGTQVVLFPPTDMPAGQWRDLVVEEWPFEFIPREGFEFATETFSDWLPKLLESREGAERLLCLTVDSWATQSAIKLLNPEQMAGECISVLSLRRVSKTNDRISTDQIVLALAIGHEHCPRRQQTRKTIGDLQQLVQSLCARSNVAQYTIGGVISDGLSTNHRLQQLNEYLRNELPHCEIQDHVLAILSINGQVSQAAAQISHVALAFLTAKAQPGTAILILDRHSETTTQGWLIAHKPLAADTSDIAVG